MKRDIFFIEPTREDLPKAPPHPVLFAVLDVLQAAGYTLKLAQEDAYIFDKVKEAIREKGITYFTNTVHLMEGILPDNTPREDLVDNLLYMVRNIQAKNELLLIDPYLCCTGPAPLLFSPLGQSPFAKNTAMLPGPAGMQPVPGF
jgi:hypothetical protein